MGNAKAGRGGLASVTGEDLEVWAGHSSLKKGATYHNSGRVRDLVIDEKGRLLASVSGRDEYYTLVWHEKGEPKSKCTCPVGYNGCKHAVAVVLEFTERMEAGKGIAAADPDDPRWDEVDEQRREKAAKGWEARIESYVREKSAEELAEMVLELIARDPDLKEEIKEKIELRGGDVDKIVKEARKELAKVSKDPGWGNHWENEGYTPDYGPVTRRLEKLIELSKFDEAVAIGREVLRLGMEQVSQSGDEGETGQAVGECMEVVFKAAAKSSLQGSDKLLFAIDALLADDYGFLDGVTDPILEVEWPEKDWHGVADALQGRLDRMGKHSDDHYHRDAVSSWLTKALKRCGRGGDELKLLEREARRTGSYQRLVGHLMEKGRLEEVERWAREGIEKTHEERPGIASSLAQTLCELAKRRGEWDVVAAHVADDFFSHPSVEGLKELVVPAEKAGCGGQARAGAIGFLETGIEPVKVTGARITIATDWPLPFPDYLRFGFNRFRSRDSKPTPHYDVLIALAADEGRVDDVLAWYDMMREKKVTVFQHVAELVAASVAGSHPERALEMYRAELDRSLRAANENAYAAVGEALQKMWPIYQRIGERAEWWGLAGAVRQEYKRRPKLMAVLDRVERGKDKVSGAPRSA